MVRAVSPRKPTIRDVAEAAGVSVTTVSHALNDVETARVKDSTRRRIQATAQRMGYSPNGLARGLRRQRSQTLALLSDRIVTTPYAGQIILGAQEKAAELGWVLTLYSSGDDRDVERREIRTLLEHQVDGVLYGAYYHREVEVPRQLSGIGVPVVLVDCTSSDPSFASVVPDEYGAARTAVQELLDHGHRRIGFVTNLDDIPATRLRLKGYRDALSEAGVEFDPDLVAQDISETVGGYRAGLRLLTQQQRPTGIFSFNDRMAMGIYRATQELGITIPTELSVVSVDNQEILAEGLYPGLTTMALPHYAMGAWSVAHLIGRLQAGEDSGRRGAEEHVVLPCPLVRRHSVAAPPIAGADAPRRRHQRHG